MMRSKIVILWLVVVCRLGAQDTLQLAPPLLRYPSAFFAGSTTVAMEFAMPGTVIRYTTNGKEPAADDPIYKKPLKIRGKSTLIKARSFADCYLPSESVEVLLLKKGITPERISCSPPVAPYTALGARSLNDTLGGMMDFGKNTWLGFNQDSVVIDIYLKKEITPNTLLLNVLQKEGSWIFLPEKIELKAWNETLQRFMPMAQRTFVPGLEPNADRCLPVLMSNIPKRSTKHLRLIVYPLRSMPEWHPGKGRAAWFFTDEVLIYP